MGIVMLQILLRLRKHLSFTIGVTASLPHLIDDEK